MRLFEVTDERGVDFDEQVIEYLKTKDFEVDDNEVRERIANLGAGELLALANAISNDDFDRVIDFAVDRNPMLEYALPGRHDQESTASKRPSTSTQDNNNSGNAGKKQSNGKVATADLGYSSDNEEEDEDELEEHLEGPFVNESGSSYYYSPKLGQYYDESSQLYFDEPDLMESVNNRRVARKKYIDRLNEARAIFLKDNSNKKAHRQMVNAAKAITALSKDRG